jgi:flavorubredoxin
LPGMQHEHGLTADKELTAGGQMPFLGCSLFVFRTTKLPEGILHIDRAGGVLVTCDSLQNYLKPDEYFSEESRKVMTDMGFFQPANLGPLWMQVNEPKEQDFIRLRELEFRHVLPGHGSPLRDTAKDSYAARFRGVFGI